MKSYTLACTAVLLLTACNQQNDPAAVDSDAPDTAETPIAETPIAANGDDALAAAGSDIPAAAQGRWGLVPADCEAGRSDAKGLLEISPTKLTFYESRGIIGAIKERGDAGIRATFDFTGEGMEWTRDMALEVKDSGKTLIRSEYGDDAEAGPFAYTRCP